MLAADQQLYFIIDKPELISLNSQRSCDIQSIHFFTSALPLTFNFDATLGVISAQLVYFLVALVAWHISRCECDAKTVKPLTSWTVESHNVSNFLCSLWHHLKCWLKPGSCMKNLRVCEMMSSCEKVLFHGIRDCLCSYKL